MPAVMPADVGDLAVVDVDRVGIDDGGRKGALELVADTPVGRGPPAVEQTRLREQEGTAANGRDPAAAGLDGPQPCEQRLVAQGRDRAVAAGHDHGVETGRAIGQPGVGHQPQSARGRQQLAVAGQELHPVGPRADPAGQVEHFEGPGYVEELDGREGDDRDVTGVGTVALCGPTVLAAMT